MKLTTPVHIPEGERRITYQDKISVIGSCFAGEIGKWFSEHRFKVEINPFGILFNPLSMASALDRLIDGISFTSDDLVQHDGLWHSMEHHGSFSGRDKDEVLDRINRQMVHGRESLLNSTWLIVTFGTAWVYERNGRVVANCHKLPSNEFVRRLAEHSEIVERWKQVSARLLRNNSKLKIVFSVSPVRYLRHGAMENQLSKSHLIIAANQLREKAVGAYFPAYEIMMDELRDYRFCASDMAHPSEMAVDWIIGKFRAAWMDSQANATADKLDPWIAYLNHRAIHEGADDSAVRKERAEQEIQNILSVGK